MVNNRLPQDVRLPQDGSKMGRCLAGACLPARARAAICHGEATRRNKLPARRLNMQLSYGLSSAQIHAGAASISNSTCNLEGRSAPAIGGIIYTAAPWHSKPTKYPDVSTTVALVTKINAEEGNDKNTNTNNVLVRESLGTGCTH